MTIDQKDIIDEIDKLHAEATPGPWSVYGVVCHIEVVFVWPNGDVVPVLRMHKEGDWPSNGWILVREVLPRRKRAKGGGE